MGLQLTVKSSEAIIQRRQGRNSAEYDSVVKNLKAETKTEADGFIILPQDHEPRNVTTHRELGSSTSIINQENANLMEIYFLN